MLPSYARQPCCTLATAVTFLALTVACDGKSASLPDELFGEWRTSERSHEDRYLCLERDGVVRFGLGDAGEQVSRVEHVTELETSGNERRFVLNCVDEAGLESELPLAYLSARGTLFVGANRGTVWVCEGTP